MENGTVSAWISWPSAPLTRSLVEKALASLSVSFARISTAPASLDASSTKLLQWSTYDAIEHDLTHTAPQRVLSSSYVFRKALIRKHFLARCIHAYLVKRPDSVLRAAAPRTWELELSFADELEDMWSDELWHLGQAIEENPSRWWILKPGMADRGMGLRLFNTRDDLQLIFEGFDEEDDDDEQGTGVVTSQLRHFVIQEYIDNTLLLDPRQFPLDGAPAPSTKLQGHKFHLRAYCVSSGALTLYLYTRILALFSSKPYGSPMPTDENDPTSIDLAPHLTNTSLQTHRGEEGVRLFDELVGCHVLSNGSAEGLEPCQLTAKHVTDIQDQMAGVLAETFKAALETPVHFQSLPNAFELYGVDFLVSHAAPDVTSGTSFQVKLLEINAEPAIELTGPRLTWILEDLFKAIATVVIKPFSTGEPEEEWKEHEIRHHLRKCLQTEVRGAAGW
ncbi:TTL-domain-containing protein [Amylostereum chailletii]|nr:TTL-domain-containing protein [Amylostereum chailletii]